MQCQHFGKSGLRVSELCLGTMSFGDAWGFGTDTAGARAVYDRFVNAGGNFLDTADFYHRGQTEEIVADLIATDRDRMVVGTKYSLTRDKTDPNGGGNSRRAMNLAVEQSLTRLKTDRIDVYWLHAWDFTTHVDEVLRGLDDLVSSGKILYIGISDTPAWIVSRANTMAELRGWTSFAGIQAHYSLVERDVERELLPMCDVLDLAVTAWGPLAAGILTGKYTRSGATTPADSKRAKQNARRLTEGVRKAAATLDAVADTVGCTSAQAALAWLRRRNPRVIPIAGARTVQQIDDILGFTSVDLSEDDMHALDAACPIELGFPHDFLDDAHVQGTLFGDHAATLLRPQKRG